MQVYYDRDADRSYLKKKRIAVIGYGSQGHAQANNLKDSDYDVVVGLRAQSPSWAKAEKAGLRVVPVAQAAAEGDIVMMLVPDELAPEVYASEIAPSMKAGKYLAFSHGFSIHYRFVRPPEEVSVFMVAPKARAIWCGMSTPEARAFPVCSQCIRTRRGTRGKLHWHTQAPLVAAGRA